MTTAPTTTEDRRFDAVEAEPTQRAVKRLLISGASGFVGRFAVPAFARAYGEAEVFACSSGAGDLLPEWPGDLTQRIRPVGVDLVDRDAVARLCGELRPDAVLHLAGQSRVADSWKLAGPTYEANVLGTVNLLDSLRKLDDPCRFVFISSGDVYGTLEPADLPVSEKRPPHPNSPYAASKVSAEIAVRQLAEGSPNLEVVILRPFAHTGPGQSPDFVCSAFARQVARIEKRMQGSVIQVGNLEAKRDYTDVRDMARAYVAAMERAPVLTPLNVCSGISHRIDSVLHRLLRLSGVTITVERDPARIRPVDTPEILGDPTEFKRATGWEPRIAFDATLADLLDWWRSTPDGAA